MKRIGHSFLTRVVVVLAGERLVIEPIDQVRDQASPLAESALELATLCSRLKVSPSS